MPTEKINPEKPYQVAIIESDRFMGQKTDHIRGFDTRNESDAFIKDYNSVNDKPEVPEWYMYARYL